MVQGVGFRYWTMNRARDFSLGGYVRNLSDGSVEVMLSGASSAVEKMMELLARGPYHAVVRGIDVLEKNQIDEPEREFRIAR